MIDKKNYKIAYFSMEIALEQGIKTYSGGLGILAGDILRSAADLKLPMIGITLISRHGYFEQRINKQGEQEEIPATDYDFSKLEKIKETAEIVIENKKIKIATWIYKIQSPDGFEIPVFLLDTDLPGNPPEYRELTNELYGRDKNWRLLQEMVLGRGGYNLLKKLGFEIRKFHINEGHGSFVAVAKFLDLKNDDLEARILKTRESCIFTTHTPVKMAHDIFPLEKVIKYQPDFPHNLKDLVANNEVNMTKIGLYFSNYINGVALSHKKLSKQMFPGYPIHCVTNGVHSVTWTSKEFQNLFDKHIPNWRNSSLSLRNAFALPLKEVWSAHQLAKKRLIALIKEKTGETFEQNIFTIGFARRFTAYKRPTLLLKNINRLIEIQKKVGALQIVYGGKSHPLDAEGKALIAEVNKIKAKNKDKIKIVFIPGYEMDLAKIIIAGVDLWVNTPLPPNEASGTSGMKAAHNGVPHLSSFDGWWTEGYIRGKTGWTIRGEKIKGNGSLNSKDAASIYDLLEKEIMPIYYHHPEDWQEIMRFTIGVNASFFNTERVLREYAQNAYL
ncbi:MAG: alpha-glucan family phosphorylase [Patescibacteria group bacterium]|jgi:starch phosphorylase|nr:alpha-glucan family phosphorylase [bacterium]HQC49654.1 alpha-glucan family phosphorylase [bacterium]